MTTYIGAKPTSGVFKMLDAITVVNNQATYDLQYNSANFKPSQAEQLLVSLNGIIQKAGSSFTVAGHQITFSSNLVTGDTIDWVLAMGEQGTVNAPADGSVTAAKLSSSIAKDGVIRVNPDELTDDVTIASGDRAMVAGPYKIGSSSTLTIEDGGVLTIV